MSLALHRFVCALVTVFTFVFILAPDHASAQARGAAAGTARERGVIAGTVADPIGARVAGADVTLLRNGIRVAAMRTDARGEFTFDTPAAGRYTLAVRANGFAPKTTAPLFASAAGHTSIDIALAIGTMEQTVVVTAAATELPASQVGAQVTVVDASTLEALGHPDLPDALRLVPGAQVIQVGQNGGQTSLFLRGGEADFTKVLVDGVPANDIGGGFDFASAATTGVERVEVLREANSVLYGSDAMSGVVSLTTRRGRTPMPEIALSFDGGNLGSVRNSLSLGGANGRFDYFSAYSFSHTDNDIPSNEYRIGTYAGRFGVQAGSSTHVSGTVRRADTRYETPDAVLYHQIADNAHQTSDYTDVGVSAESQITSQLQTTVRFASTAHNSLFVDPSGTGEPFDPFGFGAVFLSPVTTITGANGYTATGQSIVDFGDSQRNDSRTTRVLVSGQATYQFLPQVRVTGGARVEREKGSIDLGFSTSKSARTNGGGFLEGRASFNRFYLTAGLGIEHNEVFRNAVSPRVSMAAYLRTPGHTAGTTMFTDTKLIFNAGKGIKAPTILEELSSIFSILTPAQHGSLGVDPIGPERARSIDAGVEQGLWRNRARVSLVYFDNRYSDLIEFVDSTALPKLGVDPDVAAAIGFGAYVNSQSLKARGLELSGDVRISNHLRASAGYAYVDATVTKSFSSDALGPAINPSIPGIEIGAFGPLVGARPFRRPAHSGNMLVTYTQGRAQVALAGFFSGKQDDSTFLSDPSFGSSMLLPNHNLDPGYQRYDLNGSYQIHPRVKWYVTIDNVGSERYQAAAGFPALGRTFRAGAAVTFGGGARQP